MKIDGVEVQVIPPGRSGIETNNPFERRARDHRKAVSWGGRIFPSLKACGLAMGFSQYPSQSCSQYLKKGIFKGKKLIRLDE